MRLRQGKCNVSTLTEELALPQASVSKHLAILRQAGLVQATRQANQAIYSVRDRSVFQLCDIVCGGVVRHLQQEQAAIGQVLKGPRPAKAGRGAGKRKGGRR
jgi:DNA-binding transcriptional ArsR family regulator